MRSADTDPAAERIQLDLLRNATVARRATLARSLSATTLQLARRAIEQANPESDENEIAVRFVATAYGPGLAEGLRRHFERTRPGPPTHR